MTLVNVVKARKDFAELMARVAYGEERVVIKRRGKPMMAWISIEDLERLEAINEAAPSRIARRQGALAQAAAVRQTINQERSGERLPDSADHLARLREARTSELDRLR